MKDESWQKLINEAAIKLQEYHKALDAAEKEFKSRYGVYPSEVDFDAWIDALHVTGSGISVEEVKRNAEELLD